MKIYDISLPITNETLPYNTNWSNEISFIQSTLQGEKSTVYRLNLCSHTGTYIETSQHKLPNSITLESFELKRFFCKTKIIKIDLDNTKVISLEKFKNACEKQNLNIKNGDAIIICTGWGYSEHDKETFIIEAPFFSKELTEFLTKLKLNMLGVDTPVIDNQKCPYNAVKRLFVANEDLLLLAPLVINKEVITKSTYFLNTIPLNIPECSASLCRPVLIDKEDQIKTGNDYQS